MAYNNESVVSDKSQPVSIDQKLLLSIGEAAGYSGIGEHKLRKMVSEEGCSFALRNGHKMMIKRREFEEYLCTVSSI